MNMVAKLLVYAGAIAFLGAVILALTGTTLIATCGGWLELSLVLAVFSIAVKYIFGS